MKYPTASAQWKPTVYGSQQWKLFRQFSGSGWGLPQCEAGCQPLYNVVFIWFKITASGTLLTGNKTTFCCIPMMLYKY